MPDLLRFVVLSPERTLLDVGGVRKVRLLLADDAWLSIYPSHAPLLAETVAGPVTYVTDAGQDEVRLAEGILRIGNDAVTIFTGGASDMAAPRTETDARSVEGEALEFDRLAHVLMLALGAHTGDVLSNEDVGA